MNSIQQKFNKSLKLKTFSYDPLAEDDSIRLLLLEPGQPGDPISCSLIHTSITECHDNIYEQYTALSYVWGTQLNAQTIHVNSRPFRITANLAAALNDLRDEHKSLRLWADAICIDQTNNLERNHQIKHMRDIFSLAQPTVVYLGPSTGASTFVLDVLQYWWRRGSSRVLSGEKAEIRRMVASELLLRDWFTRVWTYQELVLSKEVWVQCGRQRLKWDVLCSTLLDQDHRLILSSKTPESSQSPVNMMPQFRLLLQMRDTRLRYLVGLLSDTEPESLLSILLTRRGSGVTDARDMIYGHLAVSGLHLPRKTISQTPVPEVDYDKTIAQGYAAATAFIINSMRSNGVLFHTEVFDRTLRRRDLLPSWVPDWSLGSSHHPPLLRTRIPLPKDFPSSVPSIRPHSLFIPEHLVLVYQGWRVGEVENVGFAISHQEVLTEYLVRYIKRLCALRLSWVWNLRDRNDQSRCRAQVYIHIYAFWQKVFGDASFPDLPSEPGQVIDDRNQKIFWNDAEDLYCERQRFRWNDILNFQKDYTILQQFLTQQAFRISGLNEYLEKGRKLVTVATGGLAVVPQDTRKGDLVYFQPIGNSLYFTVLRPFLDNNSETSPKPEIEKTIRERLWFRTEGMNIHFYTMIGAASLGANNHIQRLMAASIAKDVEHIIALV
ncbi:hypothetical protein ONS95_003525 [Cadophora gregata]|uniref:uncharacterized protein n=1 Tax=Cadophora gregata TaxID=51156 RepID=UPI0026DD24FE|nr:uncharacterized protein ONS95_003525 [Cadophora gregata]KAK0099403.1 hypothetical protein ONS96_008430 [Cadophora gregata f. sp. sojae]KAK0106803.1 hypothetical protein ONS95_003525 [Cadophora gregata]